MPMDPWVTQQSQKQQLKPQPTLTAAVVAFGRRLLAVGLTVLMCVVGVVVIVGMALLSSLLMLLCLVFFMWLLLVWFIVGYDIVYCCHGWCSVVDVGC